MPYLVYPPDATETTKPTYAVGYPESIDEIILQDLRKWGWTVEETAQTDPKWLTAMQEYHARMQAPPDGEEFTRLSLWNYWREENARRLAEVESTRRRSGLEKSPRASPTGSQRSSVSGLIERKGTEKVEASGGDDKDQDQNGERTSRLPAPKGGRRTIAQLRKDTAQKKEKSEDWNAPNHVNALGPLDPGHSNIYKYESGIRSKTSAEVRTQLDQEITQEIEYWEGYGGILRTTQVSVHSEEGICVDDKGKQVSFPPKHQLPLFEWEEEVPRTSSTKSRDSLAKGPLECVTDELSSFSETTDEK